MHDNKGAVMPDGAMFPSMKFRHANKKIGKAGKIERRQSFDNMQHLQQQQLSEPPPRKQIATKSSTMIFDTSAKGEPKQPQQTEFERSSTGPGRSVRIRLNDLI